LISGKRLIVNADDFGFTPDVNEGIVHGYRHGILTSTTLMANGEAFEDAVRRAREAPVLDIGCHLVLIGGRSLVPPYAPLPANLAQLVRALTARTIQPYEEMRAQIRAIQGSGLEPTHLDTHKHTHLAPPVLDAVARLSKEFGIPWVRRPFDLPYAGMHRNWITRATSAARPFFHRALQRNGCRTTDHFVGFQLTGRLRTAELVRLLHALPEGLTEFMCHPGFCREPLQKAPTRLKESREVELRALTAPDVRAAIERQAIRLVSYRTVDP
jgi:chitin disaccharide deacetylase